MNCVRLIEHPPILLMYSVDPARTSGRSWRLLVIIGSNYPIENQIPSQVGKMSFRSTLPPSSWLVRLKLSQKSTIQRIIDTKTISARVAKNVTFHHHKGAFTTLCQHGYFPSHFSLKIIAIKIYIIWSPDTNGRTFQHNKLRRNSRGIQSKTRVVEGSMLTHIFYVLLLGVRLNNNKCCVSIV